MKDNENLKWSKKDIANQYKKENPNWTWKQCWNKAKLIYKELNKLNREAFKNNDRFFKMNTPFSFFESEDSSWSSIPELNEV